MVGWLVGAPLMFFGAVGLIALGGGALGFAGKFMVALWAAWMEKRAERREERRKLAEEERQRRDLESATRATGGRRYEEVRGEEDDSLLTLVEREGRWMRVKSWFGSWLGRGAVAKKSQTKSMNEMKNYESPKDVDSDTEVDSLSGDSKRG